MSKKEDIKSQFDWNDPTIYQWKFYMKDDKLLSFIALILAQFIAVPLITYLVLLGSSFISTAFSFWFSILISTYFIYSFARIIVIRMRGRKIHASIIQDHKFIICLILFGSIFYSISCNYLIVNQGFSGSTDAGFCKWFLFLADTIIDTITFGFAKSVDFNINSIRPNIWYAYILFTILKLTIAISCIDFILLIKNIIYKKQIYYYTNQECFLKCDSFYIDDDLTVKKIGKVEPIKPRIGLKVKHILDIYGKNIDKLFDEQTY